MTAYLVGAIDVHDQETYAKYSEMTAAALEPFRRKSLVTDESPVVYAGEPPNHIAVMEFDSMEDIDRFYHSEAYQEALKVGNSASTARFMLAMQATK